MLEKEGGASPVKDKSASVPYARRRPRRAWDGGRLGEADSGTEGDDPGMTSPFGLSVMCVSWVVCSSKNAVLSMLYIGRGSSNEILEDRDTGSVGGREPLPRWLLISCASVYILIPTRFGELKRCIGRS